ncbi:MAG: hypothetical protein ACLP01_03960 [Solirubrobacteraceae bacterium]
MLEPDAESRPWAEHVRIDGASYRELTASDLENWVGLERLRDRGRGFVLGSVSSSPRRLRGTDLARILRDPNVGYVARATSG